MNKEWDTSEKCVLTLLASSYRTWAVQGFIAEFVDLDLILRLQGHMGHGGTTLESVGNTGKNNCDLE